MTALEKPRYDHKFIEKKWQDLWEEKQVYEVELDESKPKYYVLDMFPYPSGSGLHVGHVVGYTATDIMARYKRKKGFNVLHPMGWDSFGLPAEQYAIRTGTHPRETTVKNIENFRKQLKSIGFSYCWSREVMTSEPNYYKWTQWIFTKLYERGLAYEAEMLVNYCPKLGTVLANEEVSEGLSVEGGYPVERRPLKQWVLKITEYAEKLIDDLDLVDWPDGLKRLQINWIGKSQGAEVDFSIQEQSEKLTVYTTRPDTLFGATYMVISPEHPLVGKLTTKEQKDFVQNYQNLVASKSDRDRTDLAKEKTGVFTGSYAINPLNQKAIPIWIADYVLMGYGTGAIMAVPAHDERDFDFAKAFSLDIVPVYKPEGIEEAELVLAKERVWTGEGTCINSANDELSINHLSIKEAKEQVIHYLEKKGYGRKTTNYKLRDWLFSRQRYWGEPFPILHFEDGSKRCLSLDELPLLPPELVDYKPTGDGKSPLARVEEWISVEDPKTGKRAQRESNTMPQWAGSCWYYLRFCDPQNQNAAWSKDAQRYWLPVDLYMGGVEHAVLHLLYARFWHKVLYDCGLVESKEPFQKLRNQGLVMSRSYQKEGGGYLPEEEVELRGKDYYSKESGEKLRSQVEKMSKSKLNGVVPDQILEELGADSLRLYEMFMGPIEKEKTWNTDAVQGCRRFLSRFYDLFHSDKLVRDENEEASKLAQRMLNAVMQDLDKMQFNTAIAKMMEFINAFTKLATYPKSALILACHALDPLAPHMAQECFSLLGEKGLLACLPYPEIQKKYLEEATATYIIQVNGKLRARLELPKDQTKDCIVTKALENENVSKFVEGEAKKVIFVPNKLLNIVV